MSYYPGTKRVHDPLEDDREADEVRADFHEPEPWEDLDEHHDVEEEPDDE